MSDMGTPSAPPEARLIDAAQKAAVPKLSMRKAAEMAGMSEGRWRQIVKGFQGTGTGRIPVVAPDETIARMALTVGLAPDQLDEAGRPDAAGILRHLLATSEQPDVELTGVSTDRLLGEIRRRIEGAGNGKLEIAPEQGTPGEAGQGQKTSDDAEDRATDAIRSRFGSESDEGQELK
ncbi:hypothetical protein [Gordonia sp. NPDC003376]